MYELQLKQQLNNYYAEFQSIQFTSDRITWLLQYQSEIERLYNVNINNIIAAML